VFGLCGVWSARLFAYNGKLGDFGPSIVFGVAVAALCLRTIKAVPVIPLFIAVWYVAFMSAATAFDSLQNGYCAMALASAIGALGVALVGAIAQPRLRSPIALMGAVLAGVMGSVPFGRWAATTYSPRSAPTSEQSALLEISFATWQFLVGAYLFLACSPEDQPEGLLAGSKPDPIAPCSLQAP
jgi:hypothetical protein